MFRSASATSEMTAPKSAAHASVSSLVVARATPPKMGRSDAHTRSLGVERGRHLDTSTQLQRSDWSGPRSPRVWVARPSALQVCLRSSARLPSCGTLPSGQAATHNTLRSETACFRTSDESTHA